MSVMMMASTSSPWHRGERAMHERMGNAEQMETMGRKYIRNFMPDQHRIFYHQLPFMAIGAVDANGDVWASFLEGQPGFATSPDPQRLDIRALPHLGDPVLSALGVNEAVGMLGIELHTRRRNRINGKVIQADGQGFSVQVGHAFGNCPQYIQLRDFSFSRDPLTEPDPSSGGVEQLTTFDEDARELVAASDTFFVASYTNGDSNDDEADPRANRAVDVSHRGGRPGFVQITTDAEGTILRIPDFAGNNHFNTLGNLLVNPKAGLVFVDFLRGDVLQVTGSTEIIHDGPTVAAFQGAERIWTVRVKKAVRRRGGLALRWRFVDNAATASGVPEGLSAFSPNSLMTGSWEAVAATLQAASLRDAWRPFRVARIVDEAASVRSFYLTPDDGAAIVPHRAGQHLPIRLAIPVPGESDAGRLVVRTYTLSCAPSDQYYRISVKRDGVCGDGTSDGTGSANGPGRRESVSRFLHDHVRVGHHLEARVPNGEFVVDPSETRPLVLLAGGIGVTPMLAMLRHVVFEGLRRRRVRPTFFIYATRTVAERAFNIELADLVRRGAGAVQLVRVVSAPEAGMVIGSDYDALGHIDTALLKAALGFDDYDFYLCGPPRFTQTLYEGLRDLRVGDDRIHAEAFGPAALVRRPDAAAQVVPAQVVTPVAQSAVEVIFAASDTRATWKLEGGSLLDLAEEAGLAPPSSCRGGSCGTCRTKVLEGQVTYLTPPACRVGPGEALICCARPAQDADGNASNRLVLDI